MNRFAATRRFARTGALAGLFALGVGAPALATATTEPTDTAVATTDVVVDSTDVDSTGVDTTDGVATTDVGTGGDPATTDAAPAASEAPAATEAGPLDGLRVIVGNDDGVQPGEGDGMFAVRTALCAAGADVVVVAPWAQQSGTSAAITFGAVFGVADAPDAPPAPGCDTAASAGLVYGVCLADAACEADSPSATPSDAISLGINAVAAELGWDEGPDLVIVGINDGGNDGLNVPLSGTLGAAGWAVAYGAPTLALSAKSTATPESLAADAEWTVELAAALIAADALPQDYFLSINFPSPDKGEVTGVAWTTVADVAWGGTLYERDGDVFVTSYGECPYDTCGFAAEGTDSAVLEAGVVSVSPIAVDRTADADIDTAATRAVIESLSVLPAR